MLQKVCRLIEEAYTNGRITETRLSHSVKKILKAKYDANLHKYEPINITDIKKDINTKEDKDLYNEAVSNAITLIKDSNSTLLTINKNKKIAYIKIGNGNNKTFLNTLQKHIKIDDLTELSLKTKLEKIRSIRFSNYRLS
jgi:beta-N-acetylhexosaminidase